jgi:hypothetical protein
MIGGKRCKADMSFDPYASGLVFQSGRLCVRRRCKWAVHPFVHCQIPFDACLRRIVTDELPQVQRDT